ncbi:MULTISPECIES: hypothetical protein [unclassified Arenibacter]|nr:MULTISPECIES: hypothetical protein [unclassified Arenibacter]
MIISQNRKRHRYELGRRSNPILKERAVAVGRLPRYAHLTVALLAMT